MVARGAALALALLAAGCQCGFDAGKLDDLACTFDIDCRPDQDCVDDTCQQRPCSTIADCGARAEFGCIDGYCVTGELPDAGLDAGVDAAVRCDDRLDCLDALDCTEDACTDGFCTNAPRAGACAIDGACWVAGDESPSSVCQVCDPVGQPTSWTIDDSRTPSDGVDCTDDRCEGGQEVFEPDDTRCQAGETCSSCTGGCTVMPTLTVECPDVPGATGGAPVTCSVTAVGLPRSCLSCSAVVGMTSLVRDDFDGCPGLGDLGWEGNLNGINCSVPSRLGPDPDRPESQLVLDHDDVSPERWVDTTDFDAARLCFDVAFDEGDRGLLVVDVSTSGVWNEVWDSDVLTPVEEAWTNVCLDLGQLDPLAVGNATLGVRFRKGDGLGGGRIDRKVFLDNVGIDGWATRTLSWPGRVFASDFTDCALDPWVVAGDPVQCPLAANGSDSASAVNAAWTISHALDLSTRCDGLRLGFSVFGVSPDANDEIFAKIDRGAGERTVWGMGRGGPVPEGTLLPFEVSLSHVEPLLRLHTPVMLAMSVEAEGLGDAMAIDDVWVDGAECLAVPDLVSATDPPGNVGQWNIDLTGTARATAYLTCTLDGRPETTAFDRVQFCDDAECAPGSTETRACGECGTETRRCDSHCRWLDFSPCADYPCSCCDPYTGCQSCCC